MPRLRKSFLRSKVFCLAATYLIKGRKARVHLRLLLCSPVQKKKWHSAMGEKSCYLRTNCNSSHERSTFQLKMKICVWFDLWVKKYLSWSWGAISLPRNMAPVSCQAVKRKIASNFLQLFTRGEEIFKLLYGCVFDRWPCWLNINSQCNVAFFLFYNLLTTSSLKGQFDVRVCV